MAILKKKESFNSFFVQGALSHKWLMGKASNVLYVLDQTTPKPIIC